MRSYGTFPFGRPNTHRPLRPASAGSAKALIVGVYPSAFHIRWSPPHDRDDRDVSRRALPYISSLAVDVEPTVFWDGLEPSPADLLWQWKRDVGFTDAWGTAELGHNGPSGDGLVRHYLTPLGLTQSDVAMTDVVPYFFVKQGEGSQGAAIERLRLLDLRFSMRIPVGDLPSRPTPQGLVGIACGPERRESLRAELVATKAPLIVTLGQEALDAVRGVADSTNGVQERIVDDERYGIEGAVRVNSTSLRLLPLAHPGLIRQAAKDSEWRAAHDAWAANLRG